MVWLLLLCFCRYFGVADVWLWCVVAVFVFVVCVVVLLCLLRFAFFVVFAGVIVLLLRFLIVLDECVIAVFCWRCVLLFIWLFRLCAVCYSCWCGVGAILICFCISVDVLLWLPLFGFPFMVVAVVGDVVVCFLLCVFIVVLLIDYVSVCGWSVVVFLFVYVVVVLLLMCLCVSVWFLVLRLCFCWCCAVGAASVFYLLLLVWFACFFLSWFVMFGYVGCCFLFFSGVGLLVLLLL